MRCLCASWQCRDAPSAWRHPPLAVPLALRLPLACQHGWFHAAAAAATRQSWQGAPCGTVGWGLWGGLFSGEQTQHLVRLSCTSPGLPATRKLAAPTKCSVPAGCTPAADPQTFLTLFHAKCSDAAGAHHGGTQPRAQHTQVHINTERRRTITTGALNSSVARTLQAEGSSVCSMQAGGSVAPGQHTPCACTDAEGRACLELLGQACLAGAQACGAAVQDRMLTRDDLPLEGVEELLAISFSTPSMSRTICASSLIVLHSALYCALLAESATVAASLQPHAEACSEHGRAGDAFVLHGTPG